ncbi:replication initiator protein A [Streptococcus anginosus]|uniref:replication initiator protein A n=1 Tax=Streptococcus anginosus TaxID=1328 RepID=UPI00046CB7BD|nr:replication initiator protein A [Streptococcus anginosus]MDB8661577.1 replication initiator protein A [Streptococcus anginosus]MDP1384470.1 replication initiator protein A [Streptococcus anginosus]QQT10039.1 replication initiator protein A [Streptococcus anginosus]
MDYENDYYLIPKVLLQDDFYSSLSVKDILVYSVLKDRQIEAPEKGWIDVDGSVYLNFKLNELAKMFSCSRITMITIMRRLEEVNLIERERVDIYYGHSLPYKMYINEV